MDEFTRRSALRFGAVTAAAMPLLAMGTPASAGMYADDAGEEIMPGIRVVALGEWPVNFGGYKRAVVNDYIVGAGMGFPEEVMKNDMICQMVEGELKIIHNGAELPGKTGFMFSCVIGNTEFEQNEGSVPAIMRVIDLFPA